MKPTGIVRSVDNLGRVVIPKEIRRRMGIYEGTRLEFFGDDDILLKKYSTEPQLIETVNVLNDLAEDCFIDFGAEKMENIRKHIREIEKIINE